MLEIVNLNEAFDNLLNLWTNDIEQQFKRTIPKINEGIKTLVKQNIMNSKEYKSLLSGDLASQFGLPRGQEQQRLDAILSKLIGSTKVKWKVKPTKTKRSSIKFELMIESADLSSLDILPAGRVISSLGNVFEWLQHLLFEGDTVIAGYTLHQSTSYENRNDISRSRKSVMRKNKSGRWSAPSWASGTKQKNWITRALKNQDAQIKKLIEKVL